MKKTILVSLAGLALFLAGCTQQVPVSNQNFNQPAANINQNVNQPTANLNQNLNQPATNTNQPAVNQNLNINTNQPADNPSIYNNSKYGFSFQYNPKVYKVTEVNNTQWGGPEFTDAINISTLAGGNCSKGLSIIISLSTLTQELSDLEFRIGGKTSQINIGNVQATQKIGTLTENQPECGNEFTDVVFEHNNKVFVIRAHKRSDDLLNQILATFKF